VVLVALATVVVAVPELVVVEIVTVISADSAAPVVEVPLGRAEPQTPFA